MTKRFKCTACGKCCYGQLPLTWKDALTHADRFPLGLVWSPIFQTSKDFKWVGDLGATIALPDRRQLAVLIVPTSFIPGTLACPALAADNLCSIHDSKPQRCKTMPFYPYRELRYQGELIAPRQGWECDTSAEAPIVFSEGKIIEPYDFDQELNDLREQAPLVKRYATYMLKYTHGLVSQLALAASKPKGGHIVTSLS